MCAGGVSGENNRSTDSTPAPFSTLGAEGRGRPSVREEQHASCTLPTKHNPFMNILLTEYATNPTRKRACTRREVPNIKERIREKFNHGLFRNVDDLYGNVNSQRQFFVMPSTTIPNLQGELATWLYGSKGPSLKERGLIQTPITFELNRN